MIQVSPQMRILVAIEPADFRLGIDGLCRLCRQRLPADPFSGALFVFRNRRATAIKMLAYDGQGFWLFQKRLSSGKYGHWPDPGGLGGAERELLAHELQVLLAGGDFSATGAAPQWRPLEPTSLLP
jgi:transposase